MADSPEWNSLFHYVSTSYKTQKIWRKWQQRQNILNLYKMRGLKHFRRSGKSQLGLTSTVTQSVVISFYLARAWLNTALCYYVLISHRYFSNTLSITWNFRDTLILRKCDSHLSIIKKEQVYYHWNVYKITFLLFWRIFGVNGCCGQLTQEQ